MKKFIYNKNSLLKIMTLIASAITLVFLKFYEIISNSDFILFNMAIIIPMCLGFYNSVLEKIKDRTTLEFEILKECHEITSYIDKMQYVSINFSTKIGNMLNLLAKYSILYNINVANYFVPFSNSIKLLPKAALIPINGELFVFFPRNDEQIWHHCKDDFRVFIEQFAKNNFIELKEKDYPEITLYKSAEEYWQSKNVFDFQSKIIIMPPSLKI